MSRGSVLESIPSVTAYYVQSRPHWFISTCICVAFTQSGQKGCTVHIEKLLYRVELAPISCSRFNEPIGGLWVRSPGISGSLGFPRRFFKFLFKFWPARAQACRGGLSVVRTGNGVTRILKSWPRNLAFWVRCIAIDKRMGWGSAIP